MVINMQLYTLYDIGTQFYKNIFDYGQKLEYLRKTFDVFFNEFKKVMYLKQFEDEQYNYELPFPVLKDSKIYKDFNILNIQQYTIENQSELFKRMTKRDILTLRYQLSLIPNTSDDIYNDIGFQIFTDTEIDSYLFNFQEKTHTYDNDSGLQNFYNDIMINLRETNNKQLSFIVYYYLYTLISKYINSNLLFSQFVYIETIDNQDNNNLLYSNSYDMFNNLIENNKIDISYDLTNVIFYNNYRIKNITPQLKQSLQSYILNNHIPLFQEQINQYLDHNRYNFILNINSNIHNLLYGKFTQSIVDSIYDKRKNMIKFKDDDINSFRDKFEVTILNDYENRALNDTNFSDYELLLAYYRYHTTKFINIIPIISSRYINNRIKPENDHALKILSFKANLENIEFQFEKITQQLESNAHNINNVFDMLISNDGIIFDLSIIISTLDMLNDYFNSDEFNSFAETLLNDFHNYLFNQGFIQKDYDYLQNINVIKSFLGACLKEKVITHHVYSEIKNQYIDIVDQIRNTRDLSREYEDIKNSLNNIDNEIHQINYTYMWRFYENMVNTTLTINQTQALYYRYINFD